MHVDNDRDGAVNGDWEENGKWEPGAGKKGAVILCNNDNDDNDAAKEMDFENEVVDTGADVPDVAPLYLRKKPAGAAFPAGWKAVLSVSDAARVRVFDQHSASGKEIIGPNKGASHTINDLSPGEHRFGMEATSYPDATFDGKITLTLKLLDGGGTEVQPSENAIVRVSPWMMFHHACPTTKVYVVKTNDNEDFRKALSSAVTGAGLPLQMADGATYGDDRWMQDVMEPGFSTLPKSGGPATRHLPVTLRTANRRAAPPTVGFDAYSKDELLGPDYGCTEPITLQAPFQSLDSFGNLECSPPFVHEGSKRNYRFGRIVYGGGGRAMHPKVRQLLENQKVQHPFEIDTDWLVVGHVDEVISFLPLPAAPKKFKVMVASPEMALKIVDAAPNGAKLFQGVNLTPGTTSAEIAAAYPLATAGAIKVNPTFKGVQTTVQGKINDIKKKLTTELDLDPAGSDFIELPVLFEEKLGRYIAYTAGVVNMLVITKSPASLVLCIPKPFGPVVGGKCRFEEKVQSQLALPGLTIKFIDDFTTYHMLQGEIHCGTNSQRTPPVDRWWWETDWL
jgi:protein-arginine deiminase